MLWERLEMIRERMSGGKIKARSGGMVGERSDVIRAGECQRFEIDSGETAFFFLFAASLRYPAVLFDERFAAASPSRANLFLFHPVVLILPIHFPPMSVIRPQRLTHEFPGGLHPLLPSLLPNVLGA